MIEMIKQPWPWYVSGPLITVVVGLLLFFGKLFGVSGNLRTMCSIAGAGRFSEFFRFDWKAQLWNLVFVIGALIGGFVAKEFLSDGSSVAISAQTIASLKAFGFQNIATEYIPLDVINLTALGSVRGMIMIVGGGVLVGFGTRYAGGCTSGHAISGLSDLQLPSLIAVIGFFIGGVLMTHVLLPIILTL